MARQSSDVFIGAQCSLQCDTGTHPTGTITITITIDYINVRPKADE